MAKKLLLTLLFASVVFSSKSANATNAHIFYGSGNNQGLGGAGVAFAVDAASIHNNPATGGQLGHEFSISPMVAWVDQHVDTSRAPAGNMAAGNQKISKNWFAVGALGYIHPINETWTAGVSVAVDTVAVTDLKQSRLSPTLLVGNGDYDKTFMYKSLTVSPTIIYKRPEQLYGLSVALAYSDLKSDFALASPATAKAALAGTPIPRTRGNRHLDTALGIGVKGGLVWTIVPEILDFGVTVASPIWFQSFDKYKDLLIGPVNKPMTASAGVAMHFNEGLTTALLDVKGVWFKTVRQTGRAPDLGGFGWRPFAVVMFGINHKIDDWTLRAGYNWNHRPGAKNRVLGNAHVPVNMENHYNVGVAKKCDSFQFGTFEAGLNLFYAPRVSMTDTGMGDFISTIGAKTRTSMEQAGASITLRWLFGKGKES